MARAVRQKPKVKRPAARPAPAKKKTPSSAGKPTAKPIPKKSAAPPGKGTSAAPKVPAKPREPEPELNVPLPDGRHHVLSLSFVRDGDEFLARLETDSGHITEFKNRSLDQLLTLVAGELEDLVE
ncbi:MAG TPA: hypothetical protein VEG66_04125 [Thermoplasmata archaeon]|jgi:hypothetical protein|nr:hypothetical protein [Thermoplasmata archaeon]